MNESRVRANSVRRNGGAIRWAKERITAYFACCVLLFK
jgi:hypothetical protein